MFPVAVDVVGPWIITPSLNSARKVFDASLPQDVPSLPPPPGGLTTTRTPSTFCVLFYLFSLAFANCKRLCRFRFPNVTINQFTLNCNFIWFSECDQKFVSTPDGPFNGSFHAPTLINPEGDPRQCVYTFLAGPRQRVELIFTSFGLRGKPPEWVFVFIILSRLHSF